MRSVSFGSVPLTLTIVALLSVGMVEAQTVERWEWSITPYLWATDISEDLILDGTIVGGGDTEFNDLVDKLDTSLQLHFEGIKNRWGMFADLNYVELSDTETGEQGLARFEVDIEEAVYEVGAIYRPGAASGRFDLLFGGRVLAIDERYQLSLAGLEPLRTSVDDSYLDALIGARFHIPISNRWMMSLRGDVSAGDTDYIWTAQGLIGWRFGSRRQSSVFVGYRYRGMKYTKADVLEVKKSLSGFGMGVKIGF